ncbi:MULTISPECIES: DUF2927 domain-containing protein [Rhodobacterales]|uniref:DUF2927 domain-containing protein n=1 Tax=Rhodobacterales TaxID=204455 RepID=UPI0015F03978|nr:MULTISPECIES: DUF2927 domain-containing protein [Rhodobacterales]MDO6589238.1 DUF2927 domain-containing protein [Yoonia sp. 1_MG-2023]
MQRFGVLAIVAGTSACVTPPPEPTPTPPVVEALPPPPVAATPSAESQRLAVYYNRLQNDLLTQGLLRGDGGGPDTTFTDTILARNFIRIALFNEYRDDSDFRNAQSTVSNLRRWAHPIRMKIEFGDTVPYPQRAQDTASVESYAARLSRVTGVPISFDQPRPNYHVLFLGEDDRKAIEPRLRELIPTISTATVRAIVDLPRDQLCVVIGTFDPGESTYSQAIAIIRAEHPNLMRAACIHEELAQGMGLANDSPGARPSIFNDDEEFALLTTHDEMLLRMLYDPRLQAGMDPATAAPIARQIARDMMAQGAS